MQIPEAIDLVQRWQDAANRQDVPLLLELSDPHIEIVGPRGLAHGHDLLAEWVRRAGAQFTILRLFARGDRVVAAQQGVWRSPTGVVIGEAQVAVILSRRSAADCAGGALRYA